MAQMSQVLVAVHITPKAKSEVGCQHQPFLICFLTLSFTLVLLIRQGSSTNVFQALYGDTPYAASCINHSSTWNIIKTQKNKIIN